MADEQVRIAREKFTCPACGGEAVWNPAKGKLVCPFCGTESPAELAADGVLIEHDLAATLRAIPDCARGFAAASRQVRCQSCNAISVLDPSRQAQNCAFCGSAQLVPYEETKPAFTPESVLPFRRSESEARDAVGEYRAYVSDFRPMKNVLAGRNERALYKMIVEGETGRVLGIHMIGPDAPEILQAAAIAVKAGLTKEQFDETIALHPTMSEELVLMR